MAHKFSPFKKPQNDNFVDETILSTPLPEATSTVNNNRSPGHAVVPPRPIQMAGSGSRLTSTIKDLESFSKALTGAGKMSFGRNSSTFSAINGASDQSFASKSSLGVLDIDTLLENETMNNSQEIMESLYKIRDRRINMPTESLEKKESAEQGHDSLPPRIHNPALSMINSQAPSTPKVDYSVLGVPSCFLTSDSYMSYMTNIHDQTSFSHSQDLSMDDVSAEVAAIMKKGSSFDSGRVTFEPDEVSGRSTSLGMSDESSKLSTSRFYSPSHKDIDLEDENFIADENDLIKKLEMDEKSFNSKQLPPIDPECIPEPEKLEVSTFSGVIGEGQIVVRPSWVGLEGVNDEPINMSVGEFFRLKSDVLSNRIDGHQSQNERPNFGMKITSPERKTQRVALVSESMDESKFSAPVPSHTPGTKMNETQVLTPESALQKLSFSYNDQDADETAGDDTNLSIVSTPSISCINNILSEINANDSPNTMANKFLRYSSSSKGQKSPDRSSFSKNISVNTPSNDEVRVQSQSSVASRQDVNTGRKKIDKTTYVRGNAVNRKEQESKKYEIPDLVKKLNMMELGGKAEGSSLKNVASMVQKLKHNVAGPLDCSALYESLAHDMNVEGESNVDYSIMSCGPIKPEAESPSPSQECHGYVPWVEIPEELLLATGEGDVLKQRHCVGIGFTAHVPIKNVTSNWLMYEVTFLKRKSMGDVTVQTLPVQTLLSPGSCIEFEAIVVPMCVGNHAIVLEIKVTNFMAQGENSMQTYLCKLVLSADVPKIILMTETLKELKTEDALDFGLLPEDCRKKIQLHILNIGKSDIPIRVVIEEMPTVFQTFQICDATRTPLTNQKDFKKQAGHDPSKDGILLERKDLLACDLSGSGPNSMVAASLAFITPRFKNIPQGSPYIVDSSKILKLSARLRVELDVPPSLSSNFTVLKEVVLSGAVGKTKLSIAINPEPLILYSKEVALPLESIVGGHAQPSRSLGQGHKIYKPVSEYVPICNVGVVPLDLKISIHPPNEVNCQNEDVMVVVPDSLVLQPGQNFHLKVTYQPTVKQAHECDRVLALVLVPDGPTYIVQLKGMPLPMKSRLSLPKKDKAVEVRPVPTSKSKQSTNIIQATHTALVWGSVPVGSDFAEMGFAIRNSSEKLLRVIITVADNEDYKFLNHKSDMVGKASFDLLPKQTEKLKVFFRPKKLGPAAGKLAITVSDIKHPDKIITNKMIPLYGYGGHCKVEAISLPRDLAGRLWMNLGLISMLTTGSNFPSGNSSPRLRLSRPSSPSMSAPSVKNRLQIHNSGTLPAFVKIVPLTLGIDAKSLSHLDEAREHRVTVRPDVFQVSPSNCTTVWVNYAHGLVPDNTDGNTKSKNKGSSRIQEEVAKLMVISGDVPTRIRLQRIYKIADATQGTKDPGQRLGLGGTLLSFIGALSSQDGIKPELIEELNDDIEEENITVNSLRDPLTKEAVNSLAQILNTFEVMLVVDKEENLKEDVRVSTGDLTLSLANNSLEFHTLLDDGDNHLLHFPDARNSEGNLKRRQTSDIWSIEPEGTVCLGTGKGLSASLTLRSFTNTDLFFETKLGIKGERGDVKWLLPHQRQAAITSRCPLTVEPSQGQLPPYGSVILKACLPQLPSCSSNDAVLQIYSENHYLKVKIRIEGWGTALAPKQRQKNVGDYACCDFAAELKQEAERGVAIPRKETTPNEWPMSKSPNSYKENHVYSDTSVLTFPTTKVGDYNSMNITLKNVSCEPHEIQFHPISSPFLTPQGKIVIKGQYYNTFKVRFLPQNPGFYQGTMVMNASSQVSSSGNIIAVSLKGKAIL